ncbi:four helix bundle protein [Carboxylicivirga sediminis]|uniref:Four helix bundle protein n=1 Tax=Carboxylicivirga sediminis TaxID=2006564 RepID=A0A941F8J6_9BACT|nr:four helix bundle protein [Carboxylicivirga sediminis]MBR8538359.1 four helix bundle protein [Carboxylicivirga sediminis]
MYQFSFEKLKVWQLSRQFVVKIYKITANFPDEEKFGLIKQLRRAAVSISSNLAEGSARLSGKDQQKFYQYSFSSLMEVLNQLIISSDLNYITSQQLEELRTDCEEISRMINGMFKPYNP